MMKGLSKVGELFRVKIGFMYFCLSLVTLTIEAQLDSKISGIYEAIVDQTKVNMACFKFIHMIN
jgi:hypothetical protein